MKERIFVPCVDKSKGCFASTSSSGLLLSFYLKSDIEVGFSSLELNENQTWHSVTDETYRAVLDENYLLF